MKLIKVDLSTYLLILISFLCGNFKKILLILFIIIFHELGHIFYIKLFKIDIISITIYPFGGYTKTNKLLNYNPNKELLISTAGIINQLILIPIFYLLYKYNLINTYTINEFININITLIIFNLLPIIPLDGYKIYHSLLSKILPYYKVNNVTVLTSIISLVLFSVYNYKNKLNNYLVIMFLLYKLITYIKQIKYINNKYLLERIIYKLSFHKIEYLPIYKPKYLKQDTFHYFNYVPETKKIQESFDKPHNLW